MKRALQFAAVKRGDPDSKTFIAGQWYTDGTYTELALIPERKEGRIKSETPFPTRPDYDPAIYHEPYYGAIPVFGIEPISLNRSWSLYWTNCTAQIEELVENGKIKGAMIAAFNKYPSIEFPPCVLWLRGGLPDYNGIVAVLSAHEIGTWAIPALDAAIAEELAERR